MVDVPLVPKFKYILKIILRVVTTACIFGEAMTTIKELASLSSLVLSVFGICHGNVGYYADMEVDTFYNSRGSPLLAI